MEDMYNCEIVVFFEVIVVCKVYFDVEIWYNELIIGVELEWVNEYLDVL